MSGAGARYVCVPTVTVLAVMKARLVGATKGHALLKKKADALNMRFRQVSAGRDMPWGQRWHPTQHLGIDERLQCPRTPCSLLLWSARSSL